MASNGHEKKRSFGSASDLTPSSPSKLPRPASRASAGRPSREAPTLRESLQYVADRNRLSAQGSPSPAPRPSRQSPTSPERRPLAHLFPDKPIELGRAASKRPRRDGPLAAKIGVRPLPHNEGDTDEEFDRKLAQFEANDRVFEKLLKEERNGPFAKRKVIGTSIARPISARGGPLRPTNGSRDGPSQVFAETGYGRQHTDMYHRLQQLKKDPDAIANHYNFLTGTEQGVNTHGGIFGHRLSDVPPLRPATSAPSMPGSSWEIEDDFTATDMQGSTSPPVKFGRSNTRIDEIRQREIDAAREFPSPVKPLFLQRNNTKLDDIARLEKDVLMRYPLDMDGALTSPVGDLPTIDERPEGEGSRAPSIVPKSRLDEVRERVAREQVASARHSSAIEGQQRHTNTAPDVPVRSSLRGSLRFKDTSPKKDEFNIRETAQSTDPPANDHSRAFGNGPRDACEKPASTDEIPMLSRQQPTPPAEDSRDLLQRLARASSKSPSPRPGQTDFASNSERRQSAEVEPTPEVKAAAEYKFLRASKPSVGFAGISRSNSTNSISSKTSVMSGDPSARIAAEAKLFALDNNSERGSLRAPSPGSESESGADVHGKATNENQDDTPRPTKFADPAPAPTPVVTGAFIETPAPTKVEHYMEHLADEGLPSKSELPERTVTQNRDPSISPRASKSDDQRESKRQNSMHDPRRSKSTSRHRSSPVKNTAKPPSVKDDLRQIYQRNNIDDSEVDELTGLVMGAEDPGEVVKILKTELPVLDDNNNALHVDEQMKKMDSMTKALETGLAQIRNAKRGIERLEGQVSHPARPTQIPAHTKPANPGRVFDPGEDNDSFMYIQVPVPKLYRKTPKLRPTLYGFLTLLFCLWQLYWLAEGIFYNQWGKRTVCYRGETCHWDVSDPEYGYVIPVKLDQWITGGAIRSHAARLLEEAQDGWADLEDWVTDTDIRQIHHPAIRDPVKKAQYWRRIEKKGLFPEWKPASWLMPEIDEWDRQAQAREAAEAQSVMEYDLEDHEGRDDSNDSTYEGQSMSGDETVGQRW